MIAVDYGAGAKFAIFPKVELLAKTKKGDPLYGKNEAEKFILQLEHLLSIDDVVIESPTIGSSGCELEAVMKMLKSCSNTLYVISSRAVKNYCWGHGIEEHTDDDSARIIYSIAISNKVRIHPWRPNDKFQRTITSVRPSDKKGYKDKKSEEALALLPAIGELSTAAQKALRRPIKRLEYNRALVIPFGLAIMEPSASSRKQYQKILGAYDHGYPSFYRRAFNQLVKALVVDIGDPIERKNAQKQAQKIIRELWAKRRTTDKGDSEMDKSDS